MRRLRLPAEWLLVGLSGVAALGEQVAWERALWPLLGIQIYSTTAVLGVFLGGLGLGAAIAQRLLRRGCDGRTAFVLAQSGAGLAAFISMLVIRSGMLETLAAGLEPSPGETIAYLLPRILIVIGLLLPATTFMGMTLPFLLSVARSGHDPRGAGRLYAANTAGAVAGVVLGALVAIPALGLAWTVYVCAGIQLLVAGAFWRILPAAPSSLRSEAPASPAISAKWIRAYGLVGAGALGAEIYWFRILSLGGNQTVYTFATVLS